MTNIDLQVLTKNEVRSLSGHDRGNEARSFFNLDSLDTEETEVTVVAPDELDTITPSFVQGMFGRSVQRLGKEQFFVKYKFALSRYLLSDIESGIDRTQFLRKPLQLV
jgi:hypothetical protein